VRSNRVRAFRQDTPAGTALAKPGE
jgi:hypothetical protein